MKTILKTLVRAIARAVASESGDLLSTRRKAHLLHGDVYTRLGSDAETEALRTNETLDDAESGGLLATRRQAHLLQRDIYTRLGQKADAERRHAPATVARQGRGHHDHYMTPAAG